jgi:hypothetical protein
MKRSDINPMPPNFAKYIDLVPDVELEQAFDKSGRQLNELDKEVLEKLGDKYYAAGQVDCKGHSSTPRRFRQNHVLSSSNVGSQG